MQAVQVPVYDFTLHQRAEETRRVEPADVVIVEGILVLHMEAVRKLLNMKIFVDTDDDVRLARRYAPCLLTFSPVMLLIAFAWTSLHMLYSVCWMYGFPCCKCESPRCASAESSVMLQFGDVTSRASLSSILNRSSQPSISMLPLAESMQMSSYLGQGQVNNSCCLCKHLSVYINL